MKEYSLKVNGTVLHVVAATEEEAISKVEPGDIEILEVKDVIVSRRRNTP